MLCPTVVIPFCDLVFFFFCAEVWHVAKFCGPQLIHWINIYIGACGKENGSKVQFSQSTAETGQKLAGRNRSSVSPTKTVKSLFRSSFIFCRGNNKFNLSLGYPTELWQRKARTARKKKGTGNAVSQVRQPNRLMDIAEMPELIE